MIVYVCITYINGMNEMIAKYKNIRKHLCVYYISLFTHGFEENISWFHYIIA